VQILTQCNSYIDEKRFKVRLGLGSLMPLSIIFHLDHGGHFFLKHFIQENFVFIKMDICESNISHFFNYSHTCIKRSDLGQRKSGLIKEVTS
jgi:hypothetical protein